MAQEFASSRKVSRDRALAAFREIAAGEDEELADAKAPRTMIQYASAFRVYRAWCKRECREAMPSDPTPVFREFIRFLSRSGRSPQTIDSYVGALCTIARYHGRPVDRRLFTEHLKAARRRGGPPRRAKPLRATMLAAIVAGLDCDNPRDARDGALLLLAFGAALRSSEVAGLDWLRAGATAYGGSGFLAFEKGGVMVTLIRSKAAQFTPSEIPIPHADLPPLRDWLQQWVRLAEIQRGEPMFRPIDRHGHIGAARLASEAITAVVRARLVAHLVRGGTPELEARAEAARFSSHSPRRGYVTSAAESGQSLARIRRRSRHASDATLGKYIADAEDWNRSGLEGLWPSGEVGR